MDEKELIKTLTDLKEKSLKMDAEKIYICGFFNGIDLALSCIENRPANFMNVNDIQQ